jgi:4'-phosphopantetheinyl transferase
MLLIVQTGHDFAPSPALEAVWLSDLPAARRIQLQQWPDSNARRRSLVGSRLLREGLRLLGYTTEALSGLHYAPHGKPGVSVPVSVSLSHTGGRTLCALSTSGPVGVDVERIGGQTAAGFAIYLSASEREWAGDDPGRFYDLWTRKEAVVKAAGTLGLVQVRDVRIDRDRAAFAGMGWHTASVPVDQGYSAHVAFCASTPALAVHPVGADELRAC